MAERSRPTPEAGWPSVTVVCHDLSNNCLGRAHVIAQLLAPGFEVEIIGQRSGTQVWFPLRHDVSVPIVDLGQQATLGQIADRATGDVLYAVKPKSHSLMAAHLASRRRRRPLLADVDDDERAFYTVNPRWALRSAVPPWRRNGLVGTLLAERLVSRADLVTVSTSHLQRTFGGVVVPHARPRSVAETPPVGVGEVRRALVPDGRTLLLFMGSVRRHKMAVLLAALDRMDTRGLRLAVIGDGEPLPARDYLVRLPPQPYASMPRFVAAADVVVLAQDASPVSRAQLPAKLFDAMAQGVAVVASDVSDVRAVLGDGGVTVPPGDVVALAGAIESVAADSGRRRRLGEAARSRFLRKYTTESVGQGLRELVADVLVGRGR